MDVGKFGVLLDRADIAYDEIRSIERGARELLVDRRVEMGDKSGRVSAVRADRGTIEVRFRGGPQKGGWVELDLEARLGCKEDVDE